jgi:hypothetical protein
MEYLSQADFNDNNSKRALQWTVWNFSITFWAITLNPSPNPVIFLK